MKITICLIMVIELLGALPSFALDPSKIYDKLDLNIYKSHNIKQISKTTRWKIDVVDLKFNPSMISLDDLTFKKTLKPRCPPLWITTNMYHSLYVNPANFGLPNSIQNTKQQGWNSKGKGRSEK